MESFPSAPWAPWPCRVTLQVTWSNSGLLSGKEHAPGAGLAGGFGICWVEVTLQLEAANTVVPGPAFAAPQSNKLSVYAPSHTQSVPTPSDFPPMHLWELMHKTHSTHRETLALFPFFLRPLQPLQRDREKKP